MKKWESLFGDVEPNSQATFEVSSKRELVTFEMFKPKLKDSNQTLSFKIRGIGEKNKDLLTGLRNKRLSDASLFIDDSLPLYLPNCEGADLKNAELQNVNLEHADLTRADLSNADLSGADMSYANLSGAKLTVANLYRAGLLEADLSGADLAGAALFDADLSGANVYKANLLDVEWGYTTCPDGTMNFEGSPCTAEQLLLV